MPDELDNSNLNRQIRDINNGGYESLYTEELKVPNEDQLDSIRPIPKHPELAAFIRYYNNRVDVMSRYQSQDYLAIEMARVQSVLKDNLERSKAPERIKMIHRDMIMDLPRKIFDESIIAAYFKPYKEYQEIPDRNKDSNAQIKVA